MKQKKKKFITGKAQKKKKKKRKKRKKSKNRKNSISTKKMVPDIASLKIITLSAVLPV
jgi:hypothetical protein